MIIRITGAELITGKLNDGTFWAIYRCKRCKTELARGKGRSPREAKKLAKKGYDFKNKNFCIICGSKLNNRNLKNKKSNTAL